MQVERFLLLHHETGLRVIDLADELVCQASHTDLSGPTGCRPHGRMRQANANARGYCLRTRLLCAADGQDANVLGPPVWPKHNPEAKLAHIRRMLLRAEKGSVLGLCRARLALATQAPGAI
jgi:hypothetical protein